MSIVWKLKLINSTVNSCCMQTLKRTRIEGSMINEWVLLLWLLYAKSVKNQDWMVVWQWYDQWVSFIIMDVVMKETRRKIELRFYMKCSFWTTVEPPYYDFEKARKIRAWLRGVLTFSRRDACRWALWAFTVPDATRSGDRRPIYSFPTQRAPGTVGLGTRVRISHTQLK